MINQSRFIFFLNEFHVFADTLETIPTTEKLLISTLNSYSYTLTIKDNLFKQSLINSDILLPDGVSIVLASNFLYGQKIKKIAGADLFDFEMKRLDRIGGKCFFLGSTNDVLNLISNRIKSDFPNVNVQTFSPPFRSEFTIEDNQIMIEKINSFCPDVLFVGLTAPKQEKWAFSNLEIINAQHICCIGAVFDFYAGTIKRAPKWMINMGLEWLFRLAIEPKRLWKRYLIGNTLFIYNILIYKIGLKYKNQNQRR